MKRGRRFKYRLAASLLALCLLLMTGRVFASVQYSTDSDRASLEDAADILSEQEESALLQQAGDLAKLTGYEIRVLTIDDAQGKRTAAYAEDYFESLSKDFEGGCYILDLDNREYYVATYGDLRYYLTGDRIREMVNHAQDEAVAGDWAGTLSSMLTDTETYYRAGIQSGTALYDEDTGTLTEYRAPKRITPTEALMSLIIGAIGFLMLFVSTVQRYGMKVPETNDYSFRDNVSLNLRRQKDTLVNRHVKHRRIPRNPGGGSSGGGGHMHISSVHHTSGGHSAGGGGGHF